MSEALSIPIAAVTTGVVVIVVAVAVVLVVLFCSSPRRCAAVNDVACSAVITPGRSWLRHTSEPHAQSAIATSLKSRPRCHQIQRVDGRGVGGRAARWPSGQDASTMCES